MAAGVGGGWRRRREAPPVVSRFVDREQLEAMTSPELHRRAVHRAVTHLDFRFLWALIKSVPAAEAAAGHLRDAEVDVMRLSAHIDDVLEAGHSDVADELRPLYIDYLARH
ncbi:MAG: hypothetical protein ACRDJ5_09585 [Actinomycetota bacterium]